MLRDANFKTSAGARALRRALLGTSAIIAVGLASAAPAYAACTPPVFGVDDEGDPVLIDDIDPGDTITCEGLDTNGIDTTVTNLTINVIEGAAITTSSATINLRNGSNYSITNSGTLSGSRGIWLDFVNFTTIVNNGSITGTKRGIDLGASTNVTVTNNIGATITGGPDQYGVHLGDVLGDGTRIPDNNVLNNFGTITGVGAGSAGVKTEGTNSTINNHGTITGDRDGITGNGIGHTVNNDGTITGGDEGVALGSSDFAVNGDITVNNDGTITGADRGVELEGANLTVNNRGTITGLGTAGTGDGVRIIGSSVTINNWGTIRGDGQDGLNLGNDPTNSTDLLYSVVNNEGGTISGLESGIRLNAPGTVENRGTISGDDEGIIFRTVLAGSVDNFGTITAPRIGIDLDRSQNVTVTNQVGGVISVGDQRTAVLMGSNDDDEFQSDNLTFINHGLVKSLADGVTIISPNSKVTNTENITAVNRGVVIEDTATNTTITNAAGGTIEGGNFSILGGAGNESVTNAGSLIGNVDLGAGDDSFTHDFTTGSVSGTVDGGDGTDTFGIMGTGTFAFPDWAVNFEAMEVGVGTEFIIDPKGDALDLDLSLSVLGTVTHVPGTLNLTKAGAITVSGDQGKYNLADGGIIAGDGADARFLLTDMGTLVIKSPSEIFDPLGTKIDVPLETSGQGKIELLAKALLEIAKPGTYGGETTFLLDSGSRLSFSAPQTFNGQTIFAPSPGAVFHSLEEVPVISAGGRLTVKGELFLHPMILSLDDGLNLTQGLFRTAGRIIWQKGVIKGGFISDANFLAFTQGKDPGLNNFLQFGLISTSKIEMGLTVPEGGFVLDGIIAIAGAGALIVTHTLNLADQSILFNLGGIVIGNPVGIVLRGDAAIRPQVGAEAAIFSQGMLQKTGSGTSEIQVPFTSIGGDIRVDFDDVEGKELSKLVLRRASDFFGTVVVRIGGLSQLEFAHRAGELLTIHGTLNFTGSGTVKVSDADVLIKSGGRLKVKGGSITPVTTSAGDEMLKGSGGWVIAGGTITIESGTGIVVSEGGVLKWQKGTIIGLDPNFASIFNSGVMDIIGSGSHVLNGSLVNLNQVTISGSITGTGAIFNSDSGSTVILDKAGGAIDVGVFFSNTKKVIVNFGTDATFSESVIQLSDGTLSGGQWIVNNQAKLTLAPKSGSADIDEISGGAFVELRGTGTLNNLTNVVGDLDIDKSSKLFLRDVTDARVSGQLNILSNSELRLFGSKLTVGGDLEMGSNLVDIFLPFGGQLLSTLVVDSGSRLTIRDRFEVLPGGIVNINGVVTADSLDIREGALFTGSGTINTQQFNNAGQLLPGNSPGTLTINGNYTQSSTGTLFIEIGGTTPGTEYDQLIVNGIATFEPGSTIEITLLDLDGDGTLFEPQSGDTIDFLVADNVVLPAGTELGDLITFTNLPAGLQFEFGLTTLNGMTLLQILALFGIDEGLLATFNPQGQLLGGYVNNVLLDNLGSVATDDMLSDLAMLPGAQIPTALAQISPEAYGSLALTAISQANAVTDAVGGRYMRWHDPRTRKGISLWAAGLGVRSSRDGDASIGTSGSDTDLYGVTAGIDVLLSGGILLGAMAGTTNADQTFNGLRATNDSDGVFVGGYTAFSAGPLGLGVMAYHSFGNSATERSMALLGESARGEGDFNHTIVSADLFYRTGGPRGWSATPIVRATYIKVHQGALTETGSAGLTYDIQATDSEFLLLDTAVRLAGSYDTAAGTRLIPEVTLGYRQELLKEPHNIQARFVGASGAQLTLQGADFGDGQVMLGAGLTARFAGGIDLFARYSGELGTFASSHRVTAGAQITF